MPEKGDRAGYQVGKHGELFTRLPDGTVARPIVELEGDMRLGSTRIANDIASRRAENDRRNQVHVVSTTNAPLTLKGYYLPEWMRTTEGPSRDELDAEAPGELR